MIACKEGKPEIVKFLLTSGADYNLKDEHGMTWWVKDFFFKKCFSLKTFFF